MEILMAIQPITRYYALTVVAFLLLNITGILPFSSTFFTKQLAFNNLEIWRIITCFFTPLGKMSIGLIVNLLFTFYSMNSIEQQVFPIRKENFLFFLIVVAVIIISLSSIFDAFNLFESIEFAMLYFQGKFNPDAEIQFYFVITIKMKYVVFIYLIFDLLVGSPVRSIIIGIISAHIAFYLLFILPVVLDRAILKAPKFLRELLTGIH